jgi:DNA-binding Xre family transcriptional regulator
MRRYMTVQNSVREFIEKEGISVYEFRKRTGMSQGTAYSLANEPDRIPNADVLNRICEAFRIQPGEILRWLPDQKDIAA